MKSLFTMVLFAAITLPFAFEASAAPYKPRTNKFSCTECSNGIFGTFLCLGGKAKFTFSEEEATLNLPDDSEVKRPRYVDLDHLGEKPEVYYFMDNGEDPQFETTMRFTVEPQMMDGKAGMVFFSIGRAKSFEDANVRKFSCQEN